jgi:anti-sigma B factor antagonist
VEVGGSPSFSALLSEVQGVTVLRVSRELDLHSAPLFQEALERAVTAAERAEGPASKVLVVDLSEAEFMDSAGISTLIRSTQRFQDSGGEIRLAVLGGEVLRLLEVTGLDEALRVYPDALSAIEDRRGGA